jgi:uncharacterized protein
MQNKYKRPHAQILESRLAEPPRSLIVVAGPRQIGKSFMVRQVLEGFASTFVATDAPTASVATQYSDANLDSMPSFAAKPTPEWIVETWVQARSQAKRLATGLHYVLAIDEIQKIPRWSEIVKGLWDEDRAAHLPLHVILLGSSPWLMQKGLTESLAGRYEAIHMAHWAYPEMQDAFDFSLDEFIYFGGYPGAASLIKDEARWRQYVRNSLIQPNIENDILQMTRVDKPSLLKNLFELGCGAYSGQQISFTKLQGQLPEAGNTVTLTHYLDLLSKAGLLSGLAKYSVQKHRQRASVPKLNAHNNALVTALGGYSFADAKNDKSYWGRLVESCVGTHLINGKPHDAEIYYWREKSDEVDFVLSQGKQLRAIEVKSGAKFAKPRGLEVFGQMYANSKLLIVGEGAVPLQEFLSQPIQHWLD